jgi:hypothetical protein
LRAQELRGREHEGTRVQEQESGELRAGELKSAREHERGLESRRARGEES